MTRQERDQWRPVSRALAVQALLVLFAAWSLSAVTQPGAVVTVTLPPWASVAHCIVTQGDRVILDREGLKQSFTCPATTERVSCNLTEGEPFDVPLADVCGTRALPIQRALAATIVTDEPGEVVVEWLEMPLAGPAAIRATRRLVLGASTTLYVSRSPDRMLRVSRAGSSPVTVPAVALTTSRPWKLPRFAEGGELFARRKPAAVSPDAYRLTGPQSEDLKASDYATVGRPGLRQGAYQLLPSYRGGIIGNPIPLRIAEGWSTVLILPTEKVGAVVAGADPEVCGKASEFRLERRTLTTGGDTVATTIRPVSRQPVGDCFPSVHGLAPGMYRASFANEQGAIATRDVQVHAQEIARVSFARAQATLSGHVLLNDRPLADVTVELRPARNQVAQPFVSETDGSGMYYIEVDLPGTYEARLRAHGAPVLGRGKTIAVREGMNSRDWELTGGTLTLTLKGWDRTRTVSIYLNATGSSSDGSGTGSGLFLRGDEELPIRIPGLPFGTYRARANESGGGNSSIRSATLTKTHPQATIDLELVDNNAVLAVVDEAGQPIPGSRLRWGSRGTPPGKEVEPGRFSLKTVAVGEELRVRAEGLVPACRVAATVAGDLQVTLRTGRPAHVWFSRPYAGVPPGALLGLPGSDCQVLLGEFNYHVVPEADPSSAHLVFDNFPDPGGLVFVWRADNSRYPVVTEPDGSVRITLPPSRR